MSGNLLRYAPWQLRDFIRERGFAVMFIGLAIGFTFIAPMRAMSVRLSESAARQLLVAVIGQLAFLAAFISFNGMISNDRKLGYFRFLFAKPVSIPAYYVQIFVIFFAGYLTVFAILLGIFAASVYPTFPLGVLVYSALVFFSLGGIAFFVSSLFRHDWPVLAGVFLGTTIIRSQLSAADGWREIVLALLPPIHKLMPMASLANGAAVDWPAVYWLLGYSALFFVAGVLVLRRRSFA